MKMVLSVFLPFILCVHVIHFLSMNLHPMAVVAAAFSNETDRFALLAFKGQITNDPLRALSSWNDSLHFCKWQGVKCSRRRERVVALNVSRMDLKGLLSPHIANLTFLRRINLRGNKFHGSIPQDIGRLFRLRYLLLSRNTFQGGIPINITQCSELRRINLGRNSIVGEIPVELSSLPKLTVLYLHSKKLVGSIPPPFGNISSLTKLWLNKNSLHGSIPVDLCRIPNLEVLQVSAENRLSGIITSQLYNLSSMRTFNVMNNMFSGRISPDIGLTLPNLENLYMAGNQFTGPIPSSLGNASRLKILDLPDNSFSGPVPMNLGMLTRLTWFNLAGNRLGTKEGDDLRFLESLTNCVDLFLLGLEFNNLKGGLPEYVANLSTPLAMITMSKNQIFGSIPNGIGNLVGLTELAIDRNLMTGSIPVSIGKLQRLQILDLSRNRFSGSIPYSIGNISLLSELYLEENDLQRSIPPTLENCQKLRTLNLSQNSLDGPIPKQVFNLVSLTLFLSLDGNFLTGRLPDDVGNLKNLEEINIARNRMSGEIPHSLGKCLKLEYLSLEGNFFNGTIPQSLNTLKGIKSIDLSENNLSGQIPKYLGEFPFLRKLDLSFNDLDGEVPQEGLFRNLSLSSVFGNKKLCGGIPELQLLACPVVASKKQGKCQVIKVVISVLAPILCLLILSCLFVICYWRRKQTKRPSSTSSLKNQHFKVSYIELLKATDGFSSSNLIGFGSYGSVYKGVLDRDEMIVAVKVLDLQQKGASKSFMAECDDLRNIRHRNLIKVLTSCSSVDSKGDHFKAIVLEFMPNGSLEKWLHPQDDDSSLHSRKLSLIQRLNIAIDVASALEYLHHDCQTLLIHRDLKPSNVLLDADMIAHVGDFGLARFFFESDHNSQNQTSSAVIKGSIGQTLLQYEEGLILCAALDGMKLPSFPEYEVRVRYATEHRCGVVVKGPKLSGNISGTDPLKDNRLLLKGEALDDTEEAKNTAVVVNELSKEISKILVSHPLNKKRAEEGKNVANVVLFRGCGIRIEVPAFEQMHGLWPCMVAPTKIIAGLGLSLGIDILDAPGATGDYRTLLTSKATAIAKALSAPLQPCPRVFVPGGDDQKAGRADGYDFGFLHIKAIDDAGHDKASVLKVRGLEAVDRAIGQLARLLWQAESTGKFRYFLCVTGDHSTPVEYGDHSFEPVPFALCRLEDYVSAVAVVMGTPLDSFPLPSIEAGEDLREDFEVSEENRREGSKAFGGDSVSECDEIAAARGCLGRFPGSEMMGIIKTFIHMKV